MRNSGWGTEEPGGRIGLELVADRPRRIDAWIDYFGSGDARVMPISYDACGDALLDY